MWQARNMILQSYIGIELLRVWYPGPRYYGSPVMAQKSKYGQFSLAAND
jgi:hypothetical protein